MDIKNRIKEAKLHGYNEYVKTAAGAKFYEHINVTVIPGIEENAESIKVAVCNGETIYIETKTGEAFLYGCFVEDRCSEADIVRETVLFNGKKRDKLMEGKHMLDNAYTTFRENAYAHKDSVEKLADDLKQLKSVFDKVYESGIIYIADSAKNVVTITLKKLGVSERPEFEEIMDSIKWNSVDKNEAAGVAGKIRCEVKTSITNNCLCWMYVNGEEIDLDTVFAEDERCYDDDDYDYYPEAYIPLSQFDEDAVEKAAKELAEVSAEAKALFEKVFSEASKNDGSLKSLLKAKQSMSMLCDRMNNR